jgi:hypothetical protein
LKTILIIPSDIPQIDKNESAMIRGGCSPTRSGRPPLLHVPKYKPAAHYASFIWHYPPNLFKNSYNGGNQTFFASTSLALRVCISRNGYTPLCIYPSQQQNQRAPILSAYFICALALR